MYRTRKSIAVIPSTNDSVNEFTPLNRTRKQHTPKTPQNIIDSETPKTRYVDPVMARITRDLNSPSAAAHIRAKRALKSPSFMKKIYQQFDVCHERQDIITVEERRAEAETKPKTLREIFANCRIYVEVRTGDDNRSEGIKHRLLRDGIVVNEKLYKDTTHVIFKDGLLSSYKSAKKIGAAITTILWIDACTAQNRLVDPEKFKISNFDRYERPELYKRLRREKSMQPTNLTKSAGKQFKPTLDRSFSQDDTRVDPKKHDTILENEGMELTLQHNRTSSMDVEKIDCGLDKWKENIRRFTTFTPNPMEQTGRRRTLFTPQAMQASEGSVSTPDTNSGKTIIFNSSNRIGISSRRSVFDISMNILEMNCKSLSQNDKVEPPPSVETSTPSHTPSHTPAQVRKRKLFNHEEQMEDEQKENLDKSSKVKKKTKLNKSINQVADGWKTPVATKPKKKEAVKRRETIACFKPRDTTVKAKTPPKPPVSQKYVVCTNMCSADKQIIQAAILKLGGKIETEVTSRTTHVVSPNEERTMNILRGVIQSCSIVNVNWIHDSVTKGKWIETTLYTHNICDSNRVHERSVLGSKVYKNTAFAHRGPFFIMQESIENSRKIDYLKEIIYLCSGSVTGKQSEADVIICDKPSDSKETVVISTFVFDSAMKGIFLETANYRPKAKRN